MFLLGAIPILLPSIQPPKPPKVVRIPSSRPLRSVKQRPPQSATSTQAVVRFISSGSAKSALTHARLSQGAQRLPAAMGIVAAVEEDALMPRPPPSSKQSHDRPRRRHYHFSTASQTSLDSLVNDAVDGRSAKPGMEGVPTSSVERKEKRVKQEIPKRKAEKAVKEAREVKEGAPQGKLRSKDIPNARKLSQTRE